MRQKIITWIIKIKKVIIYAGRLLKNKFILGRDIFKIKWPVVKKALGKIYEWISVFSTLTIFGGLIIFIYGRVVKNNQSDNDLIMQQIIDEVAGEKIIAINVADIHGFGNDSIIVTTSNMHRDYYSEEPSNNLMILDLIENDILHKMDDLLGVKSSYKTTFLYSISCDDVDFIPKTEYVIDIIGDSTKELIVKYHISGSTYGANGTAIFAYSYADSKYMIIGTYPNSEKANVVEYDSSGNVFGRKPQIVKTEFSNGIYEGQDILRCSDGEISFNLNSGSWSGREYWVKTSSYGNALATVNIDYYNDSPAFINIYEPYYDTHNEELMWSLLYSEYLEEFPQTYSEDDLVIALVNMLGEPVTMIEMCNDKWY